MKVRSPTGGKAALTLTELVVVVAIVVLVAGVVLPKFIRSRQLASRTNCANQLKSISLGFRIWAEDNNTNGLYPMAVSTNEGGAQEPADAGAVFQVFQLLSNEICTPKVLVCLSDDRVRSTNFWQGFGNSNISYFLGLDANETTPEALLMGDRNVTGGVRTAENIVTLSDNRLIGWNQEMHNGVGNIALADGSVKRVNAAEFQKLLLDSGTTNRLAIP